MTFFLLLFNVCKQNQCSQHQELFIGTKLQMKVFQIFSVLIKTKLATAQPQYVTRNCHYITISQYITIARRKATIKLTKLAAISHDLI